MKQTETVEPPNVCWHCLVVLEKGPRPRCQNCPEECDTEGCEEPGCEATPPPTTTEEASDEYMRGFEAGCAFVMAGNEAKSSQPATVVIPQDRTSDDYQPCPDPRCNDHLGAMPIPQCVTAVRWAEEADTLREALKGMVAAFDGDGYGDKSIVDTTRKCALSGAIQTLGWDRKKAGEPKPVVCSECEAENHWHRTACSQHPRFGEPKPE